LIYLKDAVKEDRDAGDDGEGYGNAHRAPREKSLHGTILAQVQDLPRRR
jgi:hypothetical protein